MTLRAPEPFNPARHSTDTFACGRAQLDAWLRAHAGQSERGDAARTYVAAQADDEVVGYYTLVAAQIDRADATADARRGMATRFPIPVVLLARLAVDREHQGHGVGAALLADALRRSVKAADQIGIRAVLTEAIDDEAAGFYRHFGLHPATADSLTLLATVARLRAASAL